MSFSVFLDAYFRDISYLLLVPLISREVGYNAPGGCILHNRYMTTTLPFEVCRHV
jgi:hypothetical protein